MNKDLNLLRDIILGRRDFRTVIFENPEFELEIKALLNELSSCKEKIEELERENDALTTDNILLEDENASLKWSKENK